jgi:pimeloyl-ACP methyl ester carboxylesterase
MPAFEARLTSSKVTPYNLWSIRALRALAVLFLAVTFLWWVLLFVSIFVSPPGMHSRGSGFFDVSFTTLTIGNLVLSVLFFAIPSKSAEISNIILAIVLLVDMILIAAASTVRAEEGWVGMASVVWAFFISVFLVATDRIVTWAKGEEEERLTGRRETRRSLRQWCAVLTSSIFDIVLIIVALLLMATISLRVRDATLEVPGQRYYVDDNKYQVHISCVGEKLNATQPTVFVETDDDPFKYTLEQFVYNAYVNGTIPRYCYWDRPGIAFSDSAPSPHSAGMSADALSNALAQAGEEGPWILMSAGIGSIYSRIFSSRHTGDVKGLLLIDPMHENRLYEVANPGHGFFLWAWGFMSPLGLERLSGAIFHGRTSEDRVYGRVAYQNGKYIKAKLQENLVAASLTRSEVSQARNIQQRDAPLVVVSSGIHVRRDQEWEKEQRDLTRITENLVAWDVVKQAPDQVWRTLAGRQLIEKRLGQLVKA